MAAAGPARAETEAAEETKSGRGVRLGILVAAVVLVLTAAGLRMAFERRKAAAPVASMTLAEAEARLRENPDDAEAEMARGVALRGAGRLEEAVTAVSHAAQLLPDDPRPHALLATLALARGNSALARSHLSDAARRAPDDAEIWRSIADLAVREGSPMEAGPAYQEITRIDPKDAVAWRQLGLLYKQTGWLVKSREALSKAAALAPDDWEALWNLGDVSMKLGWLDEARGALERAAALKPDDPSVLAAAALLHSRTDPTPAGLAAAEKEAGRALSHGPEPFAHQVRGRIYLAQKRYPEAIREFKTALRLDPGMGNSLVYLSQAYAHTGQPALARQASEKYSADVAARIRAMEASMRAMQGAQPPAPGGPRR